MSVELPFAPVDAIIQQNAGESRASAGAAEALARRTQDRGVELVVDTAGRATADGHEALTVEDFGVQQVVDRDELSLPVAPIDRIARLRTDDCYHAAMDARIALADILKDYAINVADAVIKPVHHTDRQTVQPEDTETYFSLFE